jgi:hypothetical protein
MLLSPSHSSSGPSNSPAAFSNQPLWKWSTHQGKFNWHDFLISKSLCCSQIFYMQTNYFYTAVRFQGLWSHHDLLSSSQERIRGPTDLLRMPGIGSSSISTTPPKVTHTFYSLQYALLPCSPSKWNRPRLVCSQNSSSLYPPLTSHTHSTALSPHPRYCAHLEWFPLYLGTLLHKPSPFHPLI